MTEEQKALFKEEAKRIAKEVISLAMEFPGMGLLSICGSDDGYFDASISSEDTIFTFSKSAGNEPTWWEVPKKEKEE